MYFLLLDDLSKNQTSHYFPTWSCDPSYSCAASKSVDRINNTCMRTKEFGENSKSKTAWWFVDLGDKYSIYSVRILFDGKGHFGKGPSYIVFIFLIKNIFKMVPMLTNRCSLSSPYMYVFFKMYVDKLITCNCVNNYWKFNWIFSQSTIFIL